MKQASIDKLIELSKEELEKSKTRTKEESLNTLVQAGIMTKKGKFTKPYKELSKIIKKKNPMNKPEINIKDLQQWVVVLRSGE